MGDLTAQLKETTYSFSGGWCRAENQSEPQISLVAMSTDEPSVCTQIL